MNENEANLKICPRCKQDKKTMVRRVISKKANKLQFPMCEECFWKALEDWQETEG